jgi:hypothetical protein
MAHLSDHALTLLQRHVEACGGNKAEAGRRIGLSRAAVSQLLAGRYAARSAAKPEAKILDALDRFECPALGRVISRRECDGYAQRSAPTASPAALAHWRTCQSCQHRRPRDVE